eukprot:sb/3472004/
MFPNSGVRYVVLQKHPKTAESMLQMAGRAGRGAGGETKCYLVVPAPTPKGVVCISTKKCFRESMLPIFKGNIEKYTGNEPCCSVCAKSFVDPVAMAFSSKPKPATRNSRAYGVRVVSADQKKWIREDLFCIREDNSRGGSLSICPLTDEIISKIVNSCDKITDVEAVKVMPLTN